MSWEKILFYFFLDPITLTGEGQYNLHTLQQIKATESFLSLDGDIRGCRISTESHDDCTTRLYIEHMKLKCGCLPYSIAKQEASKDAQLL